MVAFVAPQGASATSPSDQGTLMVSKLEHPENAVLMIDEGLLVNVILLRLVQSSNAYLPILDKLEGKDVSAKLEQP